MSARKLRIEQLESRNLMATIQVDTTPELVAAALNANPSDIVHIAPGTYKPQGKLVFRTRDVTYLGRDVVVEIQANGGVEFTQSAVRNRLHWIAFVGQPTSRVSKQSGPWPTDIQVPTWVVGGGGNQFIYLEVTGFRGAGDDSKGPLGGLWYGPIIYRNGWKGPDRPHGHGLYIQNEGPAPKEIEHGIVFENESHGLHAYGSQAAKLVHIRARYNIIYNHRSERNVLLGGDAAAVDAVFSGNATFNGAVDFGTIGGLEGKGLEVTDNVSDETIRLLSKWQDAEVSDNHIQGSIQSVNSYQSTGNKFGPIGDRVVIQQSNEYETGRAHIAVYNGSNRSSVTFTPTTLISGDKWAAFKPDNLRGQPVASGTWNGGSITLPISGKFAAFVLRVPSLVPTIPTPPPSPPETPPVPPSPPPQPPTPTIPPTIPPPTPQPPQGDVIKEVVWNGTKFTLKKNNFLYITKDGKDIVGFPWQGVKDFNVNSKGVLYILKMGPQGELYRMRKNYRGDEFREALGVKSFLIDSNDKLIVTK